MPRPPRRRDARARGPHHRHRLQRHAARLPPLQRGGAGLPALRRPRAYAGRSPTTCASACTPSRTRCCRPPASATRSTGAALLHDAAAVLRLPQGAAPGRGDARSSSSTPGSRPPSRRARAYQGLIGDLAGQRRARRAARAARAPAATCAAHEAPLRRAHRARPGRDRGGGLARRAPGRSAWPRSPSRPGWPAWRSRRRRRRPDGSPGDIDHLSVGAMAVEGDDRPAPVERFLRARAAAGASPTRCARCGADLDELVRFLARAGGDPRPAAASRCAAGRRASAARRLAPATVARQLSSARALFGDLVRAGERDDPSARARRPARRGACPSPLTAGDCAPPARRPLARRRRRPARPRRARAAVRLRSARREVCGLDVADCDCAPAALRVVGKGDRERIVPIGEPARDGARRHGSRAAARESRGAASGDALLLERPRGARLRPSDVRSAARAPRTRRRDRPNSRRTRSGTPTLPICSRAARACARSRSCSATRRPRPRRSTPTSPSRISCARTPTATPEDDGCRNHHRPPSSPREELVEVWRRYKATGDRALRDRLILTYAPLVKYVAGKLGTGLPRARRGGRPHLVRPARPDRRDRALRPGPRDQVRDLRDLPHPRLDDRRAALARLGAALRAQPRARDRARDGRAREPLQARAQRRGGRRASSASRSSEFQESLTQISRSSVAALDELWTSGGDGGDTVSLIDTIEDPHAADPTRELRAGRDASEALAEAIQRLPERETPRGHALLLRGAHAARDRRGAGRHRVARVPAAHEGDPAPAACACRARSTASRARRAPLRRPHAATLPARRTRARLVAPIALRQPGGSMPYAPEKIRNVAFVGHRGTGKTSLAEALLFQAGAVTRLGTSPTARRWRTTTRTRSGARCRSRPRSLHAEHEGHKLNIIDTPGDPSFVADALGALRVVEGALFMVSGVAGVEVMTVAALAPLRRARHGARRRSSTMLDRERADFETALESLQEQLSPRCVAIAIPIGQRARVQRRHRRAAHGAPTRTRATARARPRPRRSRTTLAERGRRRGASSSWRRVVEASDELMEQLPRGRGDLGRRAARGASTSWSLRGELFPVACGSATQEHRHARAARPDRRGPAGADARRRPARARRATDEEVVIDAERAAPRPTRSRRSPTRTSASISLVRVFSGHFTPTRSSSTRARSTKERIGQVLEVQGKEHQPVPSSAPGDIGAVPKLKDVHDRRPARRPRADRRRPRRAARAGRVGRGRAQGASGEDEKMATALRRLAEEDPTLRVAPRRAHRRAARERPLADARRGHGRARASGASASRSSRTRRACRTSRRSASARAGARAATRSRPAAAASSATATSRSSRCPAHEGYEFIDKIVGGVIPQGFRPGGRQGHPGGDGARAISPAIPVVGVRVTLVDGSYHTVDSSEMAFKIAGSMAFKKAYSEADPVLLEPIMAVEIIVPEETRRRRHRRPQLAPRPAARHGAGGADDGRSGPRCRWPRCSPTRPT